MQRILIIVIWLIAVVGQVSARQTIYSVCDNHYVQSQNEAFYLKSTPFDNIEETSTGKTSVYQSDSVKLYEVDRYFELSDNWKEVFLSNNGKTIVYVINREFEWDSALNPSIEIFKDGGLVRQFRQSDLTDCNSDTEDCYLFYEKAIDSIVWDKGVKKVMYKKTATDFEKYLISRPVFLNNDTLYIFTNTEKLITVDLNTLGLGFSAMSEANPEHFMGIKPVRSKQASFKPPAVYGGLPKLSIGLALEDELAKELDMVQLPKNNKEADKYKGYSIKIEIIVDKLGNATLDKIKNYDNLPEDRIKAFIESQKMVTESIPLETEKWRFSGWVTLMNKDKKEAERERKIEILEERKAYERRIVADSLNGLYIPINLEECFQELDKLLKAKDIETIKNLEGRNATIAYHHGFGTWLRNNWGLWSGSRLQQYLLRKGIDHPDSMSAIILEYYYDWLNGKHEAWQAFDAK